MGLENGIGKKDMAAFVRSRAVNIRDMTEMASTMTSVLGEAEKEGNRDTLSEILLHLVGKKPKTKDQNKEDKGMEI